MYFETGKYYNYIVTEVIYINEEAEKRLTEDEMMAEAHHIDLEILSKYDSLAMQTSLIGEMDTYNIDDVEKELKKALGHVRTIREVKKEAKKKHEKLKTQYTKNTTIFKFPFFVRSIAVVDEDGYRDVIASDKEYRGKEDIDIKYILDSAVPFVIDLEYSSDSCFEVIENEDELREAKERIRKSIELESKTNYMDENDLQIGDELFIKRYRKTEQGGLI